MKLLQSEFAKRWESRVEQNALLSFVFSHVSLAFFYGIFLFLYEIKFLREIVPVVHPFLIAWAGLLIVYDLFIRRLWKSVPLWQVIGLFVFAAAVTAITNLSSGIVSGVKALVMTVLPLFAFYPVCLLPKGDTRKKAFLTALSGAAVIICLSSLVAIASYLLRVNMTVEWMGIKEHIGFRLYDIRFENSGIIVYGLNKDTNHAAAYAMAFAMYGVVLFDNCRKGLFAKAWQNRLGKIFAIVSIVADSIYWPLANSRGGWLALCVVGAAVAFVWTIEHVKFTQKAILRWLTSAASAALCVVLLSCSLLAIRTGTAQLSAAIGKAGFSIGSVQSGDEEGEVTEEEDGFDKVTGEMTSGRMDLWKESLILFTDSPVFGNGPNNNAADAKANGNCPILESGKAVHNSYLDLLLNYGVVGAGILMVFLVWALIKILKAVIKKTSPSDATFYLSVGIVLVTLLSGVFLSCLFINTTAMGFIAFISLGYALGEVTASAPSLPETKGA